MSENMTDISGFLSINFWGHFKNQHRKLLTVKKAPWLRKYVNLPYIEKIVRDHLALYIGW